MMAQYKFYQIQLACHKSGVVWGLLLQIRNSSFAWGAHPWYEASIM